MERHTRSRFNLQVYEDACEWFVECRSSDLDDAARREFDSWLRKSPEHLSAYLEIAAIWNEGPSLDPRHKWDSATLIAEAAAGRDNVIPLTDLAIGESSSSTAAQLMARDGRVMRDSEGSSGSAPSLRSYEASAAREDVGAKRWRLFTIAASIAVFGLGALIWSLLLRVPTYTTAVGEQRSIALADGSTVDLNSRSRIKIRYSERERGVELLEGQALFHVAKDHARPFIVTSDRMRVRAVGTQFDVYKKRGGTIVTVVEGRVAILTSAAAPDLGATAVDPHPSPLLPSSAAERERKNPARDVAAAGILLSAGEQLTVTEDIAKKTAQPNIAGATAWTQRQLVFESASLSEVAEEFNRYNERRLVIQDAELYGFHISGVFSSTDPTSLIRFLRERPGVQVVETESEIRVAKKVS